METELEIRAYHDDIHISLTEQFYIHKTLSKETFDRLHGVNWDGLEQDLITAGFKQPVSPGRDLASELDALEARVKKLEPL